jgi:HSP20 family protein
MVMRVHGYPVAGRIVNDLFNFEREVGDLFDSFLGAPAIRRSEGYLSIDLADYGDELMLVAELPGVKKEDVRITLENSLLTISGRRKERDLPENSQWLRNEVPTGEFTRVVELPHAVDAGRVSAELSNGILKISMPKPEAVRPREIRVS